MTVDILSFFFRLEELQINGSTTLHKTNHSPWDSESFI